MRAASKFIDAMRYSYLLAICPFIYLYGILNQVIGMRFDSFGRLLGLRLMTKGKFLQGVYYLINPVSIVRYFEFDFVDRSIDWSSPRRVLDISSPRLFSLYAESVHNANITMINPDKRDLTITREINQKLTYSKMELLEYDVRNLPFESASFDYVYSISVIEHISNDEDTKALMEMWRVLKPGGSLVLTVPFDEVFAEEYRDVDVYTTTKMPRNGKYFFQRRYDHESIQKRMVVPVGGEDVKYEYFLEIDKGFFDKYDKLWGERKYLMSILDPVLIHRHYRLVNDISKAKATGVVGISMMKRGADEH